MSEIKPALTAEQWAMAVTDEPLRVDSALWEMGLHGDRKPDDTDAPSALMALANAALPDADPRKITRADAELMRSLQGCIGWGPVTAAEWDANEASLKQLADKLAALLPPEPEPK